MANKKHLQILQRTVASAPETLTGEEWQTWYEASEWCQWRKAHPRIKPDLSGADLRGMVLVAIDFSRSNLSGANLSNTSLSNLEDADLSGANLSGSDLFEAVLNGADLSDANLTRSDLEMAFLHRACLVGTNFSHACLAGAEIWGASMDGANLYDADLAGTDFSDEISPEDLASMNAPKTSETSPLRITEVRADPGHIGMTLCPGKRDPAEHWRRDMLTDLEEIRNWGALILVTLAEEHELRALAIHNMARDAAASGLAWLHLPIVFDGVPDDRFDAAWKTAGAELHRRLDAGERILIHCHGGLDRTALLAARILVERGLSPQAAFDAIRAVQPHAMETEAQMHYLLNTGWDRSSMLPSPSSKV